MHESWKDSIHRQRIELAGMLREPLERLAWRCTPLWGERQGLNNLLGDAISSIPYCWCLYTLGTNGVQISDNVVRSGLLPGHFGRDRSERPYMREPIPSWGFLLSDAYISLYRRRPSLTALQVIRSQSGLLGYLGADFDLRDLPVTATLYEEPGEWRQIKGDPAIRGHLFHQTRVESRMDQTMEQVLSVLEELLTKRGVFQCQMHFSSSQATIWMVDDPFRYRILTYDALGDPDICLVYQRQPYPEGAMVPGGSVSGILENLRSLRTGDDNIYLRTASINLFNGMIGLTFSCDGSHYMRYDDFLGKSLSFWFGVAA